jgi:hypothetical protein
VGGGTLGQLPTISAAPSRTALVSQPLTALLQELDCRVLQPLGPRTHVRAGRPLFHPATPHCSPTGHSFGKWWRPKGNPHLWAAPLSRGLKAHRSALCYHALLSHECALAGRWRARARQRRRGWGKPRAPSKTSSNPHPRPHARTAQPQAPSRPPQRGLRHAHTRSKLWWKALHTLRLGWRPLVKPPEPRARSR